MTFSSTPGNSAYFITPYVELTPGDYEVTFYVKGSGYIRSVNLCTADVPEGNRRTTMARNLKPGGITYVSRPMGETVKAKLHENWIPYKSVFKVTEKAKYALNVAHNNMDGNPDTPLLISKISLSKQIP